jgi:hypothetical protein
MSPETIASTLISIPIGLVSGLYAGLVVARYQRFADLRLQAKRVVIELGCSMEGDHMVFPGRTETPELAIIASDLLLLKHRHAAEVLLKLTSQIYATIQDAKMGRITFSDYQHQLLSWQSAINAISPSPIPLLRLWAGL